MFTVFIVITQCKGASVHLSVHLIIKHWPAGVTASDTAHCKKSRNGGAAYQGVDEPDCAAAVSGQVGGAIYVKCEPGNRLGSNVALLRHRVGDARRAL